MKLVISILTLALLAFAFGLYLPWWSVALSGFLVSFFIPQHPFKSFLSGFLGIFLLWILLTVYMNSDNNGLLASRIANILPFGGSVILLIFATATAGALVGGLGALTGSLLRKLSNNGRTA